MPEAGFVNIHFVATARNRIKSKWDSAVVVIVHIIEKLASGIARSRFSNNVTVSFHYLRLLSPCTFSEELAKDGPKQQFIPQSLQNNLQESSHCSGLGHSCPWTRHARLWLASAGSWPNPWVKNVQKYFHKESWGAVTRRGKVDVGQDKNKCPGTGADPANGLPAGMAATFPSDFWIRLASSALLFGPLHGCSFSCLSILLVTIITSQDVYILIPGTFNYIVLYGKAELKFQVKVRSQVIWSSTKEISPDYPGGPNVITRVLKCGGQGDGAEESVSEWAGVRAWQLLALEMEEGSRDPKNVGILREGARPWWHLDTLWPLFWTASFQNCKIQNFYCFKLLGLWLLQ